MTSTTDRKPQPLTPYITVPDAQAAIAFYQQAFGAKLLRTAPAPDGKKLYHAHLDINGGDLMLSDDFPEANGGKGRTPPALGGTPVTLHLDLTDVDATWSTAVAAGAKVLMPLADQFWGDRYGVLEDPSGHRWSLSQRKPGA